MAIKGVFASDSGIRGESKGDFASNLLTQVPNGTAAMFALSSGMKNLAATDTIINWWEEQHLSGYTQANGAVASTVTTAVTVDDGSFITANSIFENQNTGEFVFITAVSGNVLTMVRGFAGSTPHNIADNDGFQLISSAFEEGSDKPVAIANMGQPRSNYTQIMRNAWNVTGTAKVVQFYTGDKVAKNRKDGSLFHAESIERAIMFGRKTAGSKNGQPFRTMDGFDAMIKTNVTAAGGTTNWTQLDAFLRSIFEVNIQGQPNERIAFGGNGAISVLNQIARLNSEIRIDVGQTDFGLEIVRWRTPYGSISLMTHPLFNENPFWTNDMRIYHPGAIELRWLRRTREDAYDEDGERAGADADFGVYTSELTCKYGVEKTGGRLTGMTAGAAG